MATYRTRRILPIILVIVIMIVAVAALVSLARAVFFSGNSERPAVVDVSRDALLNTGSEHRVTMTVRGPIVADEEFNSYTISVSPNNRSVTTYRGYLDTVVEQQSLGNNTAAYEQFVYALDKANLPQGRQLEGERNDVRGVCANGRMYEFSIIRGNEPVKMLWTSTCNGSRGSLEANVEQLRGLFTAQIPDARSLISNVNL
jgi:hypothetical protein